MATAAATAAAVAGVRLAGLVCGRAKRVNATGVGHATGVRAGDLLVVVDGEAVQNLNPHVRDLLKAVGQHSLGWLRPPGVV